MFLSKHGESSLLSQQKTKLRLVARSLKQDTYVKIDIWDNVCATLFRELHKGSLEQIDDEVLNSIFSDHNTLEKWLAGSSPVAISRALKLAYHKQCPRS